jgi:hypothetical protein
MLKKEDEEWLCEAHPGLLPTETGVAGIIEFRAAYDGDSNLFIILGENTPDEARGLVLSGKFNIRIEDRKAKVFSALPALYVEEIEPSMDRHFGADKSACLCSSLEEDEFLTPELQFRLVVERLVIPFLYGQVFYSLNQRWPWSEYAHYVTGLLESYGKYPDPAKVENLVQMLMRCQDVWPAIRAALRQKSYIKGHTPCFCSKKDQMRRCHPNALRGIKQLQCDIEARKMVIP